MFRGKNIITHEMVWIKQINKRVSSNIIGDTNEININLKFKNGQEQNDHIVKVLEILNED